MVSLITARCAAIEPNRIWVDSNGLFSVEARLIDLSTDKAVLLRDNGQRISIPIARLSSQDKTYLQQVRRRAAADRLLHPRRVEVAEITPLPELDLPAAQSVAGNGSSLSWNGTLQKKSSTALSNALVPDPAPHECNVRAARTRLYNVDNNDFCSKPIPIFVSSSGGQQRTAIAMSLSSNVRFPSERGANQLIRFDVETQKATGVFDYPVKLRLIDHHLSSGRSLLLVGFDLLGKGGELVVGRGWDRRFRLSHMRKLADSDRQSAAKLRWARWIDEEHFLALIDRTLGLWNIVSGEQLYRIEGIDPRAEPALSGGRRLVAVPYQGEVQWFATETGLPLGRIGVEKEFPAISFSPRADQLAIVTSRQLRIWSLTAGDFTAKIESQRNLGADPPLWIDSDFILSSSGVLSSVTREVPIWRYDLAGADTVAVGQHIAMFRKYPLPELSIVRLPHEGAANALHWIDHSPAAVNKQRWRILGQSTWKSGDWDDHDVQISAAPTQRR